MSLDLRNHNTFLHLLLKQLDTWIYVTSLQIFNEYFKMYSIIYLKSRLPRRLPPSRSYLKIPKLHQYFVLAV